MNYVGIDLGTTNSAICSYNGEQTRIWKSPEQNDVTPSAIYIGRRGNKYVGKQAYDSSARNPDNTATLFKRLMGTSTPVRLPAVAITMTPEECSGEVLRTLFGYLPEEVRNNPDTGTVITVPAAFNQMQKNATMEAAEKAGIGRVALMQEPVAAVMSVMRARDADGIFVIYDLGGGTLDVAIAESLGGRINLLAQGGIAMCGGRNFDRLMVDNLVKPWLFEEFDLPENLSANPRYKRLVRVAAWAAERAKVELSAREETAIRLEEMNVGVRDESGEEIYLDIPVQRSTLDGLMAEKVAESIEAARETLNEAGLTPHDVERVVFIGGPTNYKRNATTARCRTRTGRSSRRGTERAKPRCESFREGSSNEVPGRSRGAGRPDPGFRTRILTTTSGPRQGAEGHTDTVVLERRDSDRNLTNASDDECGNRAVQPACVGIQQPVRELPVQTGSVGTGTTRRRRAAA